MSSDWLARALLRLYPRAWRARYGDEFLALVADSGLSLRAVADVVMAASAERVRAAGALLLSEPDPTAGLSQTPRRAQDVLAEIGSFTLLVCLTVWALGRLGVPYPSWFVWLSIGFQCISRDDDLTATIASWSDRLGVETFWFASAVGLSGLAWLIAVTFSRLGVPPPSVLTVYGTLGIFVVCIGVRLIYCAIRSMVYGSTWLGMHLREVRGWNAALYMVIVLWASIDPAGEGFWAFAITFWISLRPSFYLTRAGAARRRALHEAMEQRTAGSQ